MITVGDENRPSREETMWAATTTSFEATLRESLAKLACDPSSMRKVASLGCGMFLEAAALRKVFPDAEIEGIDSQDLGTILQLGGQIPESIDLRLGDLTKPEVLGKSNYDLLVVRNPDVHKKYNWRTIYKNSHGALKDGGAIVVTCETPREVEDSAGLLAEAGFSLNFKGNNSNSIPVDKHTIWRDSFVLIAKK